MKKTLFFAFTAVLIFIHSVSFAADQIWIDDHHGPQNLDINIPINLENSITPVFAFSFHVIYNPNVLEFSGFTNGELTEDFEQFSIVENTAGDLLISGNDPTGIAVGNHGILGHVFFSTYYGSTSLDPVDFQGDISEFSLGSGSFVACVPEWLWLTRTLPESCEPGVPFNAIYSYAGGSAAIIQTSETVPHGWTITAPPWDDLIGNTYIWNGPVFNTTIVPSENSAGGTYGLTGSTISTHWCNGEVTHAITGDDTLYLDGPTPTPTPLCYHDGDVIWDLVLTANDAQTAFMIAIGTYTPDYRTACSADCNGDGLITAGDAQLIFMGVISAGSCNDPIPVITVTPGPV